VQPGSARRDKDTGAMGRGGGASVAVSCAVPSWRCAALLLVLVLLGRFAGQRA